MREKVDIIKKTTRSLRITFSKLNKNAWNVGIFPWNVRKLHGFMVKIAGSCKSCPIRHKINRITASAVSNSTKVVIETKDGTVLITISDGKLKFEHPKELEVLFPTLNDIEEFDEKFGKLSKEASEQTSLDELYRLLLRKEECQNDIQSLTKIILPAKQSDTKLTLLEKCFLLLYVRTETSKIETVTPKTDEEGDEEILETLTCLAGLNGSQSALDLSHLFNDEEEEKVDTELKLQRTLTKLTTNHIIFQRNHN